MTAVLFLSAALSIAFPAENQVLPTTSATYAIGAVEPYDASAPHDLYVNGVSVPVYRTGAFLAMVKTSVGTNSISLSYGTNVLERTFMVVGVFALCSLVF